MDFNNEFQGNKADKAEETKEKIINLLKTKGPSLPVHIAKEIGLNMLFTSAFLAELSSKKIIRTSHMKVGGSPVYFIKGHEKGLEDFAKYIKGKEKEALLLLKEKGVLKDGEQEPAIRVALRSIKDFAIPIPNPKNPSQILAWRYFTEDRTLPEEQHIKPQTAFIQKKNIFNTGKALPDFQESKKSDFAKKIISLLSSGDIEILEELESKKKEYVARIRVNSAVGKIEFLCIAKDKKRLTENDFVLISQKSQALKLPVLFISPGKPNKKAESYLESWRNLIKFKNISI